MTHARLVRHAIVLSALAVVSAGRVEAQFPSDGDPDFEAKLKAAVAAIKPLPETPIPDDPPPHEGAMIDIPYVVEPPDLLLIEVIEALPGRPITGEHLVRPDGTVALGFYGTVHVRGLTTDQIKVKVVEHLRLLLPDTTLGLLEVNVAEPGETIPPNPPPPLPGFPPLPAARSPFDLDEAPAREDASPTEEAADRPIDRRKPSPRRPVPPPERGNPRAPKVTPPRPSAGTPAPPEGAPVMRKVIAPENTNRVFVDVSAYNSQNYYVYGDVAAPGRMPITGKETVLDALTHAGGLIASADPRDIRLVRPARGGKPMKFYRVDYEAILAKGDKAENYQVFPDDRIIVGRGKLDQLTINVDRLAATLQQMTNSLMQASTTTRGLVQATPDLTPAQREALVKEWFEVVWKQSNRPGGPTPDEKTFLELLLRQLKAAPQPAPSPEKK